MNWRITMTEKLYKKYKKIKEEIEPVKDFLYWCGDKYFHKGATRQRFLFIVRLEKIAIKITSFFTGEKQYELPSELQDEIVKVMEDYIAKKEMELEKL